VLDVRDPKNPRTLTYIPAPPNTWTIHLQTHDDLLLVINAKDMFAAEEFVDERAYYSGALGKTVAKLLGDDPDMTVREDLRRFKRLLEAGELPTIEGQPHGPRPAWYRAFGGQDR